MKFKKNNYTHIILILKEYDLINLDYYHQIFMQNLLIFLLKIILKHYM